MSPDVVRLAAENKGLLWISTSSLTASRQHEDRQSVADSVIINSVLIAEKLDTRIGTVLPRYTNRRRVLLLKVREHVPRKLNDGMYPRQSLIRTLLRGPVIYQTLILILGLKVFRRSRQKQRRQGLSLSEYIAER